MKSICLNCTFFKIKDTLSGRCRVEHKNLTADEAPLTLVRHNDTCERWVDCGQQYYIRLGWLKSEKKKSEENTQ